MLVFDVMFFAVWFFMQATFTLGPSRSSNRISIISAIPSMTRPSSSTSVFRHLEITSSILPFCARSRCWQRIQATVERRLLPSAPTLQRACPWASSGANSFARPGRMRGAFCGRVFQLDDEPCRVMHHQLDMPRGLGWV